MKSPKKKPVPWAIYLASAGAAVMLAIYLVKGPREQVDYDLSSEKASNSPQYSLDCDVDFLMNDGDIEVADDGVTHFFPSGKAARFEIICSSNAWVQVQVVYSESRRESYENITLKPDEKVPGSLVSDADITIQPDKGDQGRVLVYVTDAQVTPGVGFPSGPFMESLDNKKVLWSDQIPFVFVDK